MEIPPPIPNAPKKNKNLIWILGLGGLLVCCGFPVGLGVFSWNFLQRNSGMIRCTMTMVSAGDAVDAYVKETGKYPQADKWQELIAKHYKFAETDPEDKQAVEAMQKMGFGISDIKEPLVCNPENPTTGIAYNSAVAGKAPQDIADKDTPILFETPSVSMNNHSPYKKLPKEEAPKMEGRTRDWMISTMDGGVTNSSGERIRFEAGSSSRKEDAAPAEKTGQ